MSDAKHVSACFMHFGEMCWPRWGSPAIGDVEWRLRHGQPSKSDLVVAASVMAAYRDLIGKTIHERESIVRRIKRIERQEAAK